MALRLAARAGRSFAPRSRLPSCLQVHQGAAHRSRALALRQFSDAPGKEETPKAAAEEPKPAKAPEFRVVRVPTISQAKAAPMAMRELSHEAIYILAEKGDHLANEERLRRNVMAVDGIDYSAAGNKMKDIRASSMQMIGLVTLPYKVGIATAFVTGVGSVPMVFEYNLASWFNDNFATEEVPPLDELQTVYEIGTWTWNWMEPLLGTAAFTLLALQFSRNQMLNLDIKPYTGWVKKRRSVSLAKLYPQYNTQFVMDYARSADLNTKIRVGSAL